jgi:AAA15 family ATPase/GTPase
MESEGTKKVIEMSGPIFDSLKTGKLLVVDELDAKLHPLLTRCILQLFMDPTSNPKGAQLIFATHDTNLLNLNYLRRDQIWFTEKDETEASDLYSLVEFKDESGTKVRNDRSIQKDYINGRYGAIPFFN